jgi:ribokinase
MTSSDGSGHVLVVGSLNVDLVMRAERLPRPGETIVGATFHMAPGGKGANQAVAAARLGARVAMVGRVGDDAFGRVVCDAVAAAGVRIDSVRVDATSATGTAQIVVGDRGDNAIVVASGANAQLSVRDVVDAVVAWEGASLVVLQLEIPLVTVAATVAMATERRVPVVLNAAPAQALPDDLRGTVRWLVVNEVEAEQLASCAIASVDDAARAARALRSADQNVVVTLGAAGAVLVHGSEVVHAPAPRLEVVDSTAAGDAFVGGLTAALLHGLSPPTAVHRAVAAGSVACTKAGAIPSLPTAAEVERFVQSS